MTDDFSQDIKEARGGHEVSCQEPCAYTVDTGLAGESRHQSSWETERDFLRQNIAGLQGDLALNQWLFYFVYACTCVDIHICVSVHMCPYVCMWFCMCVCNV